MLAYYSSTIFKRSYGRKFEGFFFIGKDLIFMSIYKKLLIKVEKLLKFTPVLGDYNFYILQPIFGFHMQK